MKFHQRLTKKNYDEKKKRKIRIPDRFVIYI